MNKIFNLDKCFKGAEVIDHKGNVGHYFSSSNTGKEHLFVFKLANKNFLLVVDSEGFYYPHEQISGYRLEML